MLSDFENLFAFAKTMSTCNETAQIYIISPDYLAYQCAVYCAVFSHLLSSP